MLELRKMGMDKPLIVLKNEFVDSIIEENQGNWLITKRMISKKRKLRNGIDHADYRVQRNFFNITWSSDKQISGKF